MAPTEAPRDTRSTPGRWAACRSDHRHGGRRQLIVQRGGEEATETQAVLAVGPPERWRQSLGRAAGVRFYLVEVSLLFFDWRSPHLSRLKRWDSFYRNFGFVHVCLFWDFWNLPWGSLIQYGKTTTARHGIMRVKRQTEIHPEAYLHIF